MLGQMNKLNGKEMEKTIDVFLLLLRRPTSEIKEGLFEYVSNKKDR